MWQTLLVLAFAASTFLIMPSEGTSRCQEPTTTSKPCSGGPTKPIRKCSKPNEVFDSCPAPCPPRECGVNKALILCAPAPKPGSADCKPGCRCADGYLRDKAGNCIPEKECPIKCPRNETLDPCLSLCPPRLCGVNIAAVSCLAQNPDDCKPGCRCKDGYLRNADGFCIHEDDCPQCTNPNEVYDICPAPCPPRRCDVDERVIRCAAPPKPGDPECQPGCRCADGYVRNDKGQCVTRDQCPKCTGSHEVFDSCPSSCPPQTCESIGKTYHCPKTPTKCPEGTCICEPGYYRNKIGECISEEDCLLECGTNEIISECPPFECRPLECSQVGFPVDCPEDRTKCPGKPACICDYGYVRNSAGKCIPINECPSCGGDPNAASGCGVNCGRHCSDLKNKEPVACITICYDNACDCKKGYVLDDNTKKCVLPKHCTPVCGRDEVYSDCVNGNCQPRSCSLLGYPIPCRKIDLSTCIKGCLCKDGYVRAENGTCIPKENCPSCGGDPNAVSGCGVNCGRHCSDKGKGPVACPAICNTNGCDCREGLVLDASTGKCIPPDQCVSCGGDYNAEPGCDKDYSRRCPGPKPDECKCYKDSCRCKDGFLYDPKVKKCVRPESCSPPCGDFEVLSPCSNGGCGPWTCSDVGFPTGCVKMDQKYCREGCICQEGYVRENGTCIPATECPSCGGDPNATPGCGINCGRLCSDYNKGPVACPDICLGNACDCKKGFVFDEITKKCVLPEECSPVCGKNEVYSDCINGGCQAKNCSQLGKPVPCVKPLKCQPGCLCADGYLRADDGTCVPKDQCPPKCTGLYEVYDPCPPVCPPQTCESIGKRYNCPFIPADNSSDNCHGACRCKPGYFRNKIGNCISEEDCKKCTGPNEFFSCGGACDNECANLSEQNQTNCPIINIVCNPKCYCEAEYARDANNICIPIDQCPKSQCCKNERLEQCPDWSCSLQSCKELGFPLHCPDLPSDSSAPCPGPPKCVCDYNYVRDEDGKCIPQKECPSCGGDPNAESGCGLNCGRLCSNYDKGPVPCPRICYPNACDCKDGYVYDENLKKCVRPKQCTPTCGNDEVYSECINGGCQAKNCSQLGKPVPCIKIDPKYCIKGCLCKEGYLRADNGICVPEDQCNQCNKPHEYYDACAPTCPPQTCESIGRQYNCPISPQYCKGACRCDKGYYRNKIGECISEKDCLKCKGPHEYFSCGGACDNVCSKLSYENQTNCPIINIKCNPMCYCEEGYARNDKNICVPINECPVLKCRPDERLEQCPASLCTPQTCSQLGFPIPCPALSGDTNTTCPGPPGCVCDNDYVRNEIGECIPKNECPSCGGDPNAQAGCGVHCGNLCSNYKSKPRFCPLICIVNSCDCKKGYVYDQNLKKCVVPCDCTPVCGINEVYDTCANGGCQKRNCSQVGQFKLCLDPIKCIGGCVCQEGYLRAENGSCIPENECPGGTIDKCNQQHEVYDPCPPICPPQTCESIGQKYSCPAMIDGKNCNGTCRCEKGYYRNKIGQCISEEDCLKCTGPNEYFSCGGACDNVCATLSEQNQTNCPIKNIKCNPMCYCEKGYARDDKNICVPIDQCPEKCTQQHEVYDPCPPICPPQTCESIGQKYFCPATIVGKNCKGACRCEKGYYRNKIGQCISEKDCLKCTGPNEYFSCGGACDNVCATLSERNQTNCPIKNIKCNPMCYCEKGYARDDKNICVLIDQCPVSCGGDPNAEPGCGVNCGRLCSNYKKKNVVCPLICYVDGCDCKDGYVYDSNLKKCVRPKDCTPVCGNNEVYVTCANGGCDKRNCSQLDQPALCIDPLTCIGGCVCQKGYLRTEDGTCVPEDQCPSSRCGPNEKYEENPSKVCEPLDCTEVGFPMDCPPVKDPDCEDKPACICKQGYVRDKRGVCIPTSECPSCGGDPNAVSGCGINCGRHCSDYGQEVSCILVCYDNACDCRDGFVYDDIAKKCVRYEDCTPTNTTPSNVNVTEARARLDKGNIALTGEFLYQLVSSKPNDNSVASGLSVLIPLAQLDFFSIGEVFDQLSRVLNLRNKDEIKAVFPVLTKEYKNQSNVEFEVATKYYANIGYPLSNNFIKYSEEYFDAGGENIDFSESVQAADTINAWVSDRTRGKIVDLVSPDMLNADTRLTLINAIYFKGNWIHQFNPNDTKTKDFYKSNGDTVPVKMMYQQNSFNYAENDNYQILQMFYKNDNFSFIAVLPTKTYSIKDTAETLKDAEAFQDMIGKLKYEKVQVSLPKMLIRTQLDIAEMLKKVNVTDMFLPNNGDIQGILNNTEPLYVSSAVQQAFISVDETGSEAAAATAFIGFTTTAVIANPPKIMIFNANHPFIYYILFNGIPLFCGSFAGSS